MGTASKVLVGVVTLEIKCPIGGTYRNVGYTEDGVTVDYGVTKVEINVEEETYPIKQTIQTESLKVTANLAESSLANMHIAMAGSVLAGNVLSIGSGVDKEMAIRLVGKNELGYDKTWEIPQAVASGSVGMPYRKNEKTVVPVEFTAIKGSEAIATVTDSTS